MLLTAAVGGLIALQPAINAGLGRATGSLPAALVSFTVGTLLLAVIVTTVGQAGGLSSTFDVRWYYLLGGALGVIEVSAHQIALNFVSLVFMVPLSFGIGALTRVGQAMGEGNPVRARFVAWVGTGMCIAFGLISALCIAVFRWQIAAMYTSDAAVQATCVMLLLFAALFQL